jgi:hypothetical protein
MVKECKAYQLEDPNLGQLFLDLNNRIHIQESELQNERGHIRRHVARLYVACVDASFMKKG